MRIKELNVVQCSLLHTENSNTAIKRIECRFEMNFNKIGIHKFKCKIPAEEKTHSM